MKLKTAASLHGCLICTDSQPRNRKNLSIQRLNDLSNIHKLCSKFKPEHSAYVSDAIAVRIYLIPLGSIYPELVKTTTVGIRAEKKN